jgi:S-adenosylmethionine synthetase
MSRTSEYVSIGHPDKIADYISEYILDRIIEQDKNVRYALEVQIKGVNVSLAGEITTTTNIESSDYDRWVREAVAEIGYTEEYQSRWGSENTICDKDLVVNLNVSQQSPDIAAGVQQEGWGDQGIFWGYAENNKHTDYLPLDHYIARDLGDYLYNRAKFDGKGGLDIKTQITLSNDNEIQNVIVAIPVATDEMYEEVRREVIDWLCSQEADVMHLSETGNITINGTGIYKIHGPIADCGTTGRKLAVDFYGGNSPIGGGCPWTKDSTKADLTLNLYTRDLAKNYIKNECKDCFCVKVSASCCIGKSKVLVNVEGYDENGSKRYGSEFVREVTPSELIKKYKLDESIYCNLVENGLFYMI